VGIASVVLGEDDTSQGAGTEGDAAAHRWYAQVVAVDRVVVDRMPQQHVAAALTVAAVVDRMPQQRVVAAPTVVAVVDRMEAVDAASL
jgi:hypothetical protein